MLLVIKRIALISIFFTLSSLYANTNAIKNFDINKKNTYIEDIALSKYTIFELPFKVEQKNIRVIMKKKITSNSTFEQKLTLLNNTNLKAVKKDDKNLLNDSKKPPLPGKKDKNLQNSHVKPKLIKKKNTSQVKILNNYIEVFPKELGELELIVFGGSKPLILTLNVKTESEVKYIKVIDSAKKIESEKIKFNLNANKKVLFLNFFRYLYSNKDLPNFEKITAYKQTEFYKGKIIANLKKHYKNEKYEVKEYEIVNKLPIDYYIKDDVFKEQNTRAISFVTQDNFIYKGQSSRYFLINEL